MLRLLRIGKMKKGFQSLRPSSTSFVSQESKNGDSCFSQYRLYSKCLLPSRNNACNSYIGSYSTIPVRNTVGYNWRSGWEMLASASHKRHNRVPMSKIAQAVSLGLNRSYSVVPSLLGLMGVTRLSQAQSSLEPRNNNYARAETGHIYLTRLIFSMYEGVYLLLRGLYLAVLFMPSVAMAPFADAFGPQFRKLWVQVIHWTLERAGPAFIKWGQWAAERPDLFPRDLCSELKKLQSRAPEHSFAFTKKTIEKAFGRKISEIFEDFVEKPEKSGSIGQVHQASLHSRYPGKQHKPILVAVKVKHPGVDELMKRDFEILKLVARISNFFPSLRWMRLDETMQEFADFMMLQVDLAREATHLCRFRHNFRSWKDVSFPEPIYPLVHPAVLVETYENGESVSHYVDELAGNVQLKSALAHIGTHALLKMLLVDNFVHTDLHPGNLLVRSRIKLFKTKPHVIFLDVGMITELSKNDQVNLIKFFTAVVLRDGKTAAECTLRLSKKQECRKPEAFIQDVTESFDFWGTPEGDLIHHAECVHQLLEKVRHHKVNIDGNVCAVIVTFLILEGWQRKLDPNYDVMHTLETLLLQADQAESLSYTMEGLMAP